MSQPSLSAQVGKLEAALGVQLVERDRRGVMITTAGSELIERMRRVLVEVDDVSEAARRFPDPLAGTLRIGVIPTIGPYLLPTVAPVLHKELPRLTLAWLEDKTEALVRRIRHGNLDGALLALEADIGALNYETIEEDPFVLATHLLTALEGRPHPYPSAGCGVSTFFCLMRGTAFAIRLSSSVVEEELRNSVFGQQVCRRLCRWCAPTWVSPCCHASLCLPKLFGLTL